MMRFTPRVCFASGVLFFLGTTLAAAELTVENYIKLTVSRLELIDASWRAKDQPPTEEEMQVLYASYDTDRESYFCFAGENRREIESYLERHPESRDTIEALASAIRKKVSERSEDR